MRTLHLALTGGLLVACGSDPSGHDSHAHTVPAACDDGAPPDVFVADIERLTAAGEVVRITNAIPAPPNVGINQFVVETPGSTPTSVRLRPFMPLHGHGTTTREWFDGVPEGGAFTFGPADLDLFMPGLWELRFTLDSDDPDTGALFRFCLEG